MHSPLSVLPTSFLAFLQSTLYPLVETRQCPHGPPDTFQIPYPSSHILSDKSPARLCSLISYHPMTKLGSFLSTRSSLPTHQFSLPPSPQAQCKLVTAWDTLAPASSPSRQSLILQVFGILSFWGVNHISLDLGQLLLFHTMIFYFQLPWSQHTVSITSHEFLSVPGGVSFTSVLLWSCITPNTQ